MSSFTINRVVLIGRLTRDPELRALPSGLSVCGLRIACNSARRDTEGEYHDKPNFFDVSVFGASAESVNRYTRKASRIAIDGRLEWHEWENSDLQKRQAVSVVADTVQFLDAPAEQPGGEPGDGAATDRRSVSEDYELVGVGTDERNDLVL